MIHSFFPKMMVKTVADIDLALLVERGIKGLIVDIDNTLVANHVKEAGEDTVKWVEKAKKLGLKVCLVSNAPKIRVVRFNEKLCLPVIYRAIKPMKRPFKHALRILKLEHLEVAVIGDQIFTDIYGGNRFGMFTILVNPLDGNESMIGRIKRIAEGRIEKAYLKITGKPMRP